LMVASLLKSQLAGIPLFSSANALLKTLQGKGLLGPVMAQLGLQAPKLQSVEELKKAVATESKVFSIYATGVATSGKRRTLRRIHAVVDFEGAPKPPDLSKALSSLEESGDLNADSMQQALNKALPANLPDDASPDTLVAAFRPSPAGRVIYYRIE
jgi:general secretion pathway protein K